MSCKPQKCAPFIVQYLSIESTKWEYIYTNRFRNNSRLSSRQNPLSVTLTNLDTDMNKNEIKNVTNYLFL